MELKNDDIKKIALEFIKDLRHSDQTRIDSCEPRENGWFVIGYTKITQESLSVTEYFEIEIDKKGAIVSYELGPYPCAR